MRLLPEVADQLSVLGCSVIDEVLDAIFVQNEQLTLLTLIPFPAQTAGLIEAHVRRLDAHVHDLTSSRSHLHTHFHHVFESMLVCAHHERIVVATALQASTPKIADVLGNALPDFARVLVGHRDYWTVGRIAD